MTGKKKKKKKKKRKKKKKKGSLERTKLVDAFSAAKVN